MKYSLIFIFLLLLFNSNNNNSPKYTIELNGFVDIMCEIQTDNESTKKTYCVKEVSFVGNNNVKYALDGIIWDNSVYLHRPYRKYYTKRESLITSPNYRSQNESLRYITGGDRYKLSKDSLNDIFHIAFNIKGNGLLVVAGENSFSVDITDDEDEDLLLGATIECETNVIDTNYIVLTDSFSTFELSLEQLDLLEYRKITSDTLYRKIM